MGTESILFPVKWGLHKQIKDKVFRAFWAFLSTSTYFLPTSTLAISFKWIYKLYGIVYIQIVAYLIIL